MRLVSWVFLVEKSFVFVREHYWEILKMFSINCTILIMLDRLELQAINPNHVMVLQDSINQDFSIKDSMIDNILKPRIGNKHVYPSLLIAIRGVRALL